MVKTDVVYEVNSAVEEVVETFEAVIGETGVLVKLKVGDKVVRTSEEVSEQGTTVVTVTSRSVVIVLFAVRGQSVTEEGHLVKVSVRVERIVEVVHEVDEADVLDVSVVVEKIVEVVHDVESIEVLLNDDAVTGDTTAFVLELKDAVEEELLKLLVVSEQGTTVVRVAIRVVVYVLFEVRGQLATLEGHWVIVSVMVESIVDVVKDGDEEVVPLVGDTTVEELVVVASEPEVELTKVVGLVKLLVDTALEVEVVKYELVEVMVETIDVETVEVTVESE